MAQQGYLAELNAAQREAVEHGVEAASRGEPIPPLLIIAGAGSGKTNALAHRVSHLILNGVDPARLLLLTFTRRAAVEMTRRARRILAQARAQTASRGAPLPERARSGEIHWSGTFHAVANRLLRMHSDSIGLDPSFTVLDRSDGEDLLNLLRDELGLASKSARFPKKATCMSIYSHAVNAQRPLEEVLEVAFPWCAAWKEELPRLFAAYVEAKLKIFPRKNHHLFMMELTGKVKMKLLITLRYRVYGTI